MIIGSSVATSIGVTISVVLAPILQPGFSWSCKGTLEDGRKCKAELGRVVGREIVINMAAINTGSGDPMDPDNGMVLTDFELRVCCKVCKAVRVWSFGRR